MGGVPINTRFWGKKYRGHLLERDITHFNFPTYAMFKSDRTSLHLFQTNSENAIYSLFTFLSLLWVAENCSLTLPGETMWPFDFSAFP